MPNIASVLKSEIARLARKEAKSATQALRRLVHAQRSQIASLKRSVAELERGIASAGGRARRAAAVAAADGHPTQLRFSAKGLLAQRKRLGLSAQDVGLLLGTTGQTIYNWEAAKARPRAGHMPAIAALRKLGRRQANAILVERRP